MTAREPNDTAGEKYTDTAAVSKSYPDEWRGVRFGVEPEHVFGCVDSGWALVELDSIARECDSRLSADVRYQEADPETVREVDFLIEYGDEDGKLEAAATLDPEQAVEFALSILDEIQVEA